MAKTLHSRKNTIFLSMLRGLREARHLRQSDLADLVGRSQAMVSNVERGERTLDVIELWEWLEALEVDFITFLSAFDSELRQLGVTKVPAALRKRHRPSNSVAPLKRVVASIADGDRYPNTLLHDDEGFGSPAGSRAANDYAESEADRHQDYDSQLRSCRAVEGYHVHATDGEIGHIVGLVMDDRSWAIHYLVVNTGAWWLGHQVLVAPTWIADVS